MKHRKNTLYADIVSFMEQGIRNGLFASDRRLPSEMELARKFKTSRPTVVRAMLELKNRGLIDRRVGSGTFIRQRPASSSRFSSEQAAKSLGFIVAGLGNTEILDPICTEIFQQAQSRGYMILRGDQPVSETADADFSPEHAQSLARQYVQRRVQGVFFAPLELPAGRAAINHDIARILTDAGIAVVLLDRDVPEFPQRSPWDLVGIDNFTAGFVLASHLVERQARSLCFLAYPNYPSTTDMRLAGCREALLGAKLPSHLFHTCFGDPGDRAWVGKIIKTLRPDAIACSNDRTAAILMQTLTDLNKRVPHDLLVAGFDDVRYATLLSVPLTTMRQPCRSIGLAAMALMSERIEQPHLPARSVLLNAQLIERASTNKLVGYP